METLPDLCSKMEVQGGCVSGCTICVVIHETDGAFFGHPKFSLESPSKRGLVVAELRINPCFSSPFCPACTRSVISIDITEILEEQASVCRNG